VKLQTSPSEGNDERKQIAKQMKKEGFPIEVIAEMTGLDTAVINKLKVE